MSNFETPKIAPSIENLKKTARQRWGIENLDDTFTVLQKLTQLGGKMPDMADLGNLWRSYQELQTKQQPLKIFKKAA